jgi:hypothetical protein
MVDQAAEILVPPCPYRHLERIERKIRTQVIRDLPAENNAGEQIHHESGIDPAGKRLDIGDVRDPAAVRRRRVEAPIQQVRWPVRRVTRQCRRGPLPPGAGTADPQLAHQPFNRAPRHRGSPAVQLQPDFPRTVNLPPFLPFPHLHDLLLQDHVADFPRRRLRLAFLGVVIRRHGKFKDRAGRLDTEPVPVRINELD